MGRVSVIEHSKHNFYFVSRAHFNKSACGDDCLDEASERVVSEANEAGGVCFEGCLLPTPCSPQSPGFVFSGAESKQMFPFEPLKLIARDAGSFFTAASPPTPLDTHVMLRSCERGESIVCFFSGDIPREESSLKHAWQRSLRGRSLCGREVRIKKRRRSIWFWIDQHNSNSFWTSAANPTLNDFIAPPFPCEYVFVLVSAPL